MKGIDSFSGEYRFLSNFYLVPVVYELEHYRSVEHAYQAAKTDNRTMREAISKAVRPGEAKRIGRTVPLVPHWDTKRILVMHELLKQKFSYDNMYLGSRLVATGEAELVEGNTWHDNFWGNCTCSQALNDSNTTSVGTPLRPRCLSPGENWLGRLLMVVREELNPWLKP